MIVCPWKICVKAKTNTTAQTTTVTRPVEVTIKPKLINPELTSKKNLIQIKKI